MKFVKVVVVSLCMLSLLTACSSVAVQPQFAFPSQKTGLAPSAPGKTRLVIFNASNALLHGMDRTGKLNIVLDGKGVGRLYMGEYLVIEVRRGVHRVQLEHTDMVSFKSSHTIRVSGKESYLRASATITSNSAAIVPRPADFSSHYEQAYPGKDDL